MSLSSGNSQASQEKESGVISVIKPEQPTPNTSSPLLGTGSPIDKIAIDATHVYAKQPRPSIAMPKLHQTECFCHDDQILLETEMMIKSSSSDLDKVIKEREAALEMEFRHQLHAETTLLKEKFDVILQNEELRAAYMLRHAHRECQDKITALQTQLECKNLAGLMYVMASERKKCKLQVLQVTEEYTNYINALKALLKEGKELILHLSRGYKTAARVDNEWRQKMKNVMTEFQNYVQNFIGRDSAQCQFLFDPPRLMKTEATLEDNPDENPCEYEEFVAEEEEEEKPWWERLEGDCRPFIMYGDMGEFKAKERREVLKQVKAEKAAPKKWKEYMFHDMFVKGDCPNWDSIKNMYQFSPLIPVSMDNHGVQTAEVTTSWLSSQQDHNSNANRRYTIPSIDTRANMGSILKMITATSHGSDPVSKAILLAARDSIEITSTTKMKEKRKESHSHCEKVTIDVRNRKASTFKAMSDEFEEYEFIKPSSSTENTINYAPPEEEYLKNEHEQGNEEEEVDQISKLGSIHRNSIEVVPHVPDPDSKMTEEKYCPMEACRLRQMDSFIRSLPQYMRAGPNALYEQTFDTYEACTPEQLAIIRERLDKKRRSKRDTLIIEDPCVEWEVKEEGVATQTTWSHESIYCDCPGPSPTPMSTASNAGRVYQTDELVKIKQLIDHITMSCLYSDDIEKKRFELVGEKKTSYDRRRPHEIDHDGRIQDIRRMLEENPSLCSVFQ